MRTHTNVYERIRTYTNYKNKIKRKNKNKLTLRKQQGRKISAHSSGRRRAGCVSARLWDSAIGEKRALRNPPYVMK